MSSTAKRLARINPHKTAFFVCDLQERFRLVIHSYPNVLQTAEKMIKAANILDIPVIVTEQAPKFSPPPPHRHHAHPHKKPLGLVALGKTVPLPLEQLECPRLRPEWVPLAKTKFSMVVPQVEEEIEKRGTKDVVLFGIESHVCVLQTALDLLEKDINVHVLADGVSSCNGDEVGIALKRMRDAGAQITTSESILFQILHDAADPRFKALAGLIKEYKDSTANALTHLINGRGF
ncbi:hypothetical protein JCM10207_005665 [Rhodosporidiobolus poonsookiae]